MSQQPKTGRLTEMLVQREPYQALLINKREDPTHLLISEGAFVLLVHDLVLDHGVVFLAGLILIGGASVGVHLLWPVGVLGSVFPARL